MRLIHATQVLLIVTATGVSQAAAAAGKQKHSHSHKAHVHGNAELNVAAEDKAVRFDLEAPAEVIFGFEHAPQNDAEKATVAGGLEKLRTSAGTLFDIPADAGCQPGKVTVTSDLENANGQKKPAKGGHSDVDASWEFTCTAALAGKSVIVKLFQEFPRLKKLKTQVISGSGSKGLNLTPAKNSIQL